MGKNKNNNFPKFILMGLIIIILIMVIVYYLFLYYSPQMIIAYNGYAIEPKVIASNLQVENGAEESLNLVEVKEDDTVFKKLNTYYIGSNQKKKIDINYPIYIAGKAVIINMSKDTKLITVNYEEVEGYPEFTITEGVMYNGDDLLRADGNEYIFLKTKDDIYTNVKDIKIETSNNKYEIPIFSQIYFLEDRITYYEVQGDSLKYGKIEDIDEISKININGEELTYKEFLIKMGIIEEKKSPSKEENTEEPANNTEVVNDQLPEKEEPKDEEPKDNENVYKKPEASLTNIQPNVYTMTGDLDIKDPSGAITKAITLEIRKDEKIFKRVSYSSGGKIQIIGLQPKSIYEITGKMTYKDENGKERTEEFTKFEIKTDKVETLGTIKLHYENGEIYSNKIELKNFRIENNIQEEVIRGISRIEVIVNGNKYKIKSADIKKLLQGETIVYQTEETVKSNSTIKYEIHIYDKYQNELKIEENKGETRTSKEKPSVDIKLKSQETTEVKIGIELTNKDNVNIKNYRYVITDSGKNEISSGNLKQNQKEITLTDLNPNDYYIIRIYGDYDLGDNKGMQKDAIIGEGKITTLPIASLGYVRLNVNVEKANRDNSEISMQIDGDVTDKKLINILSYAEIKIIQQDEETGNHNDTGSQIQILSAEELNRLKNEETLNFTFENLKSSTTYQILITIKATQGTVENEIQVNYTTKEFTTLKIPAEVQIRNQFITGEMIDFDIRVEDVDAAVLNNKVAIELRDERANLIERTEIETNKEYARETYTKLEANKLYTLKVYAGEYNEGNTDATYKKNYTLKEINLYTEVGISGEVNLTNLSKKGTGKNLINVASENNWYVYPIFDVYSWYGKKYNTETKELRLGGSRINRNAVYDLRDYAGQEITMSFKIKYVDSSNKGTIYVQNAKTEKNRTVITGITNDYSEKTYTMKLDESGYLGFYIAGGNGVYIKDLQIELGNKKTDYEEFKYKLNAEIRVNLEDKKNEIPTKDYYLRIYKNNNKISEERYQEINEKNKVENSVKNYIVDENTKYKIVLLIKIRDRFYTINTVEFETESGKEIKGIFNEDDFFEIQPNGNYIVYSDLNLYDKRYGMFGNIVWGDNIGNYIVFNGTIDFNGHSVVGKKDTHGLFGVVGPNGTVKNLVLNVRLTNETGRGRYGMIAMRNQGTLTNIQINLKECTKVANSDIELLIYTNEGTLSNFSVNFEESLFGVYNLNLVGVNDGTVKNGYVYGKNITVDNIQKNIASSAVVRVNRKYGVISNIYSLVSIDTLNGECTDYANIATYHQQNASINNVYSVGKGNNYNLERGPNVYSIGNSNITNNYYFTDEIFKSSYHLKTTKLALWDKTFQNQILNNSTSDTDGAFAVDELVDNGYYPHLKMPDCMPRQMYIALPEVQDSDLPDILSTDVIEQGTDKVKVKFSVNNPSAEQITSIRIENLNVNIVDQKYADGKSEVIAELYDPIKYTSSYNLMSITSKGTTNIPYTRTFKSGERTIYVDLYKEINSTADWKEINNSPTENYMLMNDLDFCNEGNTIQISNIYNGKLNGNNHTIRNIFLENAFLFRNFQGTLENLYIENFQKTNTTWIESGLIAELRNADIDNVHINNTKIKYSEMLSAIEIGVFARTVTASRIKNSSCRNIEIISNNTKILNYIDIGGFICNMSQSSMENSYVDHFTIKMGNTPDSRIGGLVSKEDGNSTIINCYATNGSISAKSKNIGGSVGYIGNGSRISNSYSYVDLSSNDDFIGGIVGNSVNGIQNDITNNLSVGNIYTSSISEKMSRIVGNSQDVKNNYAFQLQKINGYITDEKLGANLITYDDMLNEKTYTNIIALGDSYDYSKVTSGILPKLYNTNGKDLLPNQPDAKLEIKTNLTIDEITTEKSESDSINVVAVINNPSELKITDVEVDDMNFSILKNNTQKGKTYIEAKGTPIRFYDSYKISKIKYLLGNEEKEILTENRIEAQFYKELNSYEDWQSIEEGTYQNYKLLADIDFNGKSDMKKNVTMGRLESSGKTLKNASITVTSTYSGLIKEVSKTLIGVNFENINIQSPNSVTYIGVIAKCTGKIENINFTDITIENKNMQDSYVGCIGTTDGDDISNIKLENINIKAHAYVAGLTGKCNNNIKNINANNVTIMANDYYIGGIVGYLSNEAKVLEYVNVNNSNITGKYYTGGIIGYCYGKVTESSVTDTNVFGNNYVGGMHGGKTLGERYHYNNHVKNCKVLGSGSYIGGLTGSSTAYEYYAIVENTNIEATSVNSQFVGGIDGNESYYIRSCKVVNCDILSKGDYVGGIAGKGSANGNHDPKACMVVNTRVTGRAKVGGLMGVTNAGSIYSNLVSADVTATGGFAGGLVGYLANSSMTENMNTIYIYNNIVANTNVIAPSYVGGFIGGFEKELYEVKGKTFYYNNYIHAYVNSDDDKVSMGIGADKNENSKLSNTYIYEYSKINGEYISENNDSYKASQYLTAEDLKKETTYRNKIRLSNFDYSPLKNNKYPLPSGVPNQDGIDLPEDPIDTQEAKEQMIAMATNLEDRVDLPENTSNEISYNVYAISANEINIDFTNVDSGTLAIDNTEIPITSRTYTFKYDFLTSKTLKLKTADKEITISIRPDELRSYISLNDDTYAVLKDNKLKINDEEQSGEYVNLVNNQALTTNGEIYNTLTKTIVQSINKVEGLVLEKTVKPLKQYSYQENTIKQYGKYSTINGDVRKQIYIVKNGKLSILSSSLNMKIGQAIIENANGKEYETILKDDGTLQDLKEPLVYPENFENSEIKQIYQNSNTDKPEVAIYYENGNVVIFNYLTGKLKTRQEKSTSNFFVKMGYAVSNLFTNSDEKALLVEYKETQKLVENLKKLPIEEAMQQNLDLSTENSIGNNLNSGNVETNMTNTENITQNSTETTNKQQEYITSYSPTTQKYEIYSDKEILESSSEEPQSETSKITANGLEKFYNASKAEGKQVKETSGITIIITIISAIVICIIIGNKIQVQNKKSVNK